MADICIVYATGEGQTAKVAERLVEHLSDLGHMAEAYHVEELPNALAITDYDGVLVGASIHRGKHQKRIKSFIGDHLDALSTLPSGFFQVSLSAAIADEESQAEALGYVDELIEETGWHPDRFAIFGGALRYSEYGFLTRSMMKYIAKRATGDTDTSRDYEYTDWEEVEQFAEAFGVFVEEQLTVRSAVDEAVVD